MKITIEKLGKIDKASFEIKDLTIFVGKNSTNKSYVANSVYMLNKVLFDVTQNFNYTSIKTELLFSYDYNFEKKLYTLYKKTSEKIQINENEEKELKFTAKNLLEKKITKLINSSFNTDKELLKSIKIDIDFSKKSKYSTEIIEDIKENFNKQKIAKKSFYFPASRTGFILALEEIASGLFKNAFSAKKTSTKLTEPTIDFISTLMDIKLNKFNDDSYKNRVKKIEKILKFIEERLTKAKIIEDKNENEYLNFYLQPKNSEKIELHLSSSSAIELLPLVIFLKHFSRLDDKFLIIEEPEAHLHPQAQIEIAQLIVMLVNAGAKVLITTHSDYILSEINNCIKLTNIQKSKRDEYLKKYKLNESVLINKNRVSAYLFKEKRDKVIVDELSIDKYGIANDNFDEVLDELLDRTQEINESF